jgi:hypothetical protein
MIYSNIDTTSVKEAALLIRYDNNIGAGGIIVETQSPTGAAARDTLFVNPVPDMASNNMREMRLPFRRGVVLGEAGEYRFTLTPLTEIRGIWSAGIDFQKQK